MALLVPILGITWIFGIFAVNEELIVFQYLFAISNSFQVCIQPYSFKSHENAFRITLS